MPIKNSFSVLFCNFKLVGKIFIFILIVMLIAAAVLMSVLSPVLQGYFEKMQEEMPVTPEEILQHPIKSLEKFLGYFTDFIEQNASMVNTRLIYLGLLIILFRFLILLPMFPVTKILHEKMTSGFDVGLINAFLSTLVHNLLFSLVSAIILGMVDILIFVGALYMTLGLFHLMGILSLPLALLITIGVYSLRMALTSQILPEFFMEKPKTVFHAIIPGLKLTFKQFSKNFICIFATSTIFFGALSATFLPTVGLLPILLIPTIMVTQTALYLILNYSYKRHKYFTDNGVTVYNPTKLGNAE